MSAPVRITGIVSACSQSEPRPASVTDYTIDTWLPGAGLVSLTEQVPSYWRWPENMRTNGPGMIGLPVGGYVWGGRLYWDFIEPPDFTDCDGNRPTVAPMLDPLTELPTTVFGTGGTAGAVPGTPGDPS